MRTESSSKASRSTTIQSEGLKYFDSSLKLVWFADLGGNRVMQRPKPWCPSWHVVCGTQMRKETSWRQRSFWCCSFSSKHPHLVRRKSLDLAEIQQASPWMRWSSYEEFESSFCRITRSIGCCMNKKLRLLLLGWPRLKFPVPCPSDVLAPNGFGLSAGVAGMVHHYMQV